MHFGSTDVAPARRGAIGMDGRSKAHTPDLVVPFKGSKLLGFPAIPDSVSGWRERNKCMQAEPTQSFNNGSVSCDTWCSGVQNVTLCSVRGGGHSWPGATAALCPSSGPFACSRDMDATREIWAFFKRYSL